MSPDYNKAAIKAAETLVRYNVNKAPVSPLPILEQMDNVIVTSFDELGSAQGYRPCDLALMFGKGQDAVTSIHTDNGRTWYVVAYNSLLPFSIVQHALAREMGHIVLGHQEGSRENMEEAVCFAHHLLCPRPLIHAIQATAIRFTTDLLARLTGVYDQCMACMRHLPGTAVPSGLNCFVRSQFMPFIINFFSYYRSAVHDDGSALVDFGTYMDGYEE